MMFSSVSPFYARIHVLFFVLGVASVCISCGGANPGGQGTDNGSDGVDTAETEDSGSSFEDVGSEDITETPDEPWTYNTCSVETRVGGFEVTLADEYTGINGQVLGGVVPVNIPEVMEEDGACRLFKARSLFCVPSCVPGETCGEEETCIPYPEALSVGAVTVTGLKTSQTMEAKWGNHYTNAGSLEHPAFEEGASLHLSAVGGEGEAFDLAGLGIAPLTLPMGSGVVTVVDGEGIALQWNAGVAKDEIRIHIELNINNHGSTGAWIVCEAEDTGAFSIPAGLVSALYSYGVSGFPSLALTRQSADSTELEFGCVEFLVASERAVSIDIDGVTSCTSNAQCPPGETCGADLQCHE